MRKLPTAKQIARLIDNPEQKPSNPNAAEKAAWVWLRGGNVKAMAAATGYAERTIYQWMSAPWWERSVAAARRKWMVKFERDTRKALKQAIKSPDLNVSATTARWAAERIIPELAPPAVKMQQTMDVTVQRGADAKARLLALMEPKPKKKKQGDDE